VRIVSNLQHPSIVGVLDFGEVDGEYIMVLEYVHGFHLGNWWRYVMDARQQMPLAHAVEVMLPILDALDFAHRLTRGDGTPLDIVHRDISPANILLDHLGNVKLHDFGIARMADDEFKTQDGTFRGTLSFTAPETLHGIPASPRSDLYACGVVLYQLLAGANPFRGEQPSETLHRVVMHVPPRLRSRRNDVPEAIDAVIARALEKDPARRFDSAGSFAAALRAARTWLEADAAVELASVIHSDFTGPEMAAFLGVETLQSRDAAWRAAQPAPENTPLGSSRPPSGQAFVETGQIAGDAQSPTVQAMPSEALLRLVRDGATRVAENEVTSVATVPPLTPSLLPSAATSSSAAARAPRRLWLPIFGMAGGALVLAGGAYALLRPAPPPPVPRFLLIEKESEPGQIAAASSSASLAASAPAPSPVDAPSSSRSSVPALGLKPPRAGSEAPGSSLTAAFQKQRGRVEACFRAQPGEASAQPQLTLRFQIDATGAVRSVELSPAAVAGTGLGGCILGVARNTRFPAGDAPMSFTIPITARKTGG
jgi:eukaryotic-like serine/threonine-protein kinase